MKKLLWIFTLFSLIFSMVSCFGATDCTEHTDADGSKFVYMNVIPDRGTATVTGH